MLVYVTGSLRNARVKEIANELRQRSEFDVFDDYMAVGPEADDYWIQYESDRGHSYAEGLRGRAADHVFYYDKAYLDLADVVVVVLPAGKSSMLEAGYSAARGKLVYLLRGPDEDDGRYDVMKKFSAGMIDSVENLKEAILSAAAKYLPIEESAYET